MLQAKEKYFPSTLGIVQRIYDAFPHYVRPSRNESSRRRFPLRLSQPPEGEKEGGGRRVSLCTTRKLSAVGRLCKRC